MLETQRIAQTILQQLGGQSRLKAMIGAYDFTALSEGGLSFKFKGSQKFNYLKVELMPSDTYKLTFQRWSWSKFELKGEESFDDVYAEDLVSFFESETGLYLSI